jgi:hypothetical protein
MNYWHMLKQTQTCRELLKIVSELKDTLVLTDLDHIQQVLH